MIKIQFRVRLTLGLGTVFQSVRFFGSSFRQSSRIQSFFFIVACFSFRTPPPPPPVYHPNAEPIRTRKAPTETQTGTHAYMHSTLIKIGCLRENSSAKQGDLNDNQFGRLTARKPSNYPNSIKYRSIIARISSPLFPSPPHTHTLGFFLSNNQTFELSAENM